mmetsp:Transcript_20479/g.36958  ORF Transcript_20479/g.36958 Transcript_20479/m.36958 type:complete len:236 (-) Transcript_20479:313-1020(-)
MLLLHRLNKMSQFHHSPMSTIIPLLLSVHKEFQCRIRPNTASHTQFVMINTVHLTNQNWQLHSNSSLIILIAILMLFMRILVEMLLHTIFRHLVHDLGQCFPRGRQIATVGAPTGEKVDKDVSVLLQCHVEGGLVEGDGILPIRVELLDGLFDRGIKELDIVLLHVALLIPLADAESIDGEFLHVLCHVLLRPQHGDHVDGGVFALQIHHGDVEIDPDLTVRIAVQCKGCFEGRG